jgi:hypothetical protein
VNDWVNDCDCSKCTRNKREFRIRLIGTGIMLVVTIAVLGFIGYGATISDRQEPVDHFRRLLSVGFIIFGFASGIRGIWSDQ